MTCTQILLIATYLHLFFLISSCKSHKDTTDILEIGAEDADGNIPVEIEERNGHLFFPTSWFNGEKITDFFEIKDKSQELPSLRARLLDQGYLILDIRKYTANIRQKMDDLFEFRCSPEESQAISLRGFLNATDFDEVISDITPSQRSVLNKALKASIPEGSFSKSCPFLVTGEMVNLLTKLTKFFNRLPKKGKPSPFVIRFELRNMWNFSKLIDIQAHDWHVDGLSESSVFKFLGMATVGSYSYADHEEAQDGSSVGKPQKQIVLKPNGTELIGDEYRPPLNIGSGTLLIFTADKARIDFPNIPATIHRGTAYDDEERTAIGLTVYRLDDYIQEFKKN